MFVSSFPFYLLIFWSLSLVSAVNGDTVDTLRQQLLEAKEENLSRRLQLIELKDEVLSCKQKNMDLEKQNSDLRGSNTLAEQKISDLNSELNILKSQHQSKNIQSSVVDSLSGLSDSLSKSIEDVSLGGISNSFSKSMENVTFSGLSNFFSKTISDVKKKVDDSGFTISEIVNSVSDYVLDKHGKIASQLWEAAENGNLDSIPDILDSLKEGVELVVNKKEHHSGDTALHKSSKGGHNEIIEYLISRGAVLDAKNNMGWTPLNTASCFGQVQTVKFLISKGAKVVDSESETTVLHATVCADISEATDHIQIFEEYLSLGIPIDIVDKGGMSPLYSACKEGFIDWARYLLKRGANPSAADLDGNTLLHLSTSAGNIPLTKLILTELNHLLDKSNNDGMTSLHVARNRDVVDLLIEAKINVNQEDKNGATALHFACVNGDIDVVEVLIRAGAKVTVENIKVNTTLHSALAKYSSQHNTIFDILAAAGALSDINKPNAIGDTPLHVAVRSANIAAVKKLLANGADPNVVNSEGETALHMASHPACTHGIELVNALLTKADVTRVNGKGETALHVAVSKSGTSLWQQWLGNNDVAEALLVAGSDPNKKNYDGKSALHLEVGNYCRPAVVEALLAYGGKVGLFTSSTMLGSAHSSIDLAKKNPNCNKIIDRIVHHH